MAMKIVSERVDGQSIRVSREVLRLGEKGECVCEKVNGKRGRGRYRGWVKQESVLVRG